ncbi:hypothetical protein IFM89_004286 [Coptis chinensis]|uniref:Homeobox domain-containing protein n=1 Tax=Coptis chinensis TaxID=261450 RepID=A0A835I793_9MAGN|nr:hypothetical protein IFM89_004286 [Coptis chinensis]
MPQMYSTSRQYTPVQYADVLIQQFSQQLRTLYNYGARKVALIGVGQIGCSPNALANSPDGCTYASRIINNMSCRLFNDRLRNMVDNLNNNLDDSQFIYVNAYGIFNDIIRNPASNVPPATTRALCWFVSPYVHKLTWQPGSDSFEVITQASKLLLHQSHNIGSGHVEQRTVNLNRVPTKEVRKPLQELVERHVKRRKCSIEDRQPLLIKGSGPCAKRKGNDENSSDNDFVQPPKRRAIAPCLISNLRNVPRILLVIMAMDAKKAMVAEILALDQKRASLFKECPHPNDKQRMKLSQELGLKPSQVKFWFQNRRTQMKTQQDISNYVILRASNENLKNEGFRLQAALRSISCPNCGGPTILGQMSFDEQHLRIENVRLKEEEVDMHGEEEVACTKVAPKAERARLQGPNIFTEVPFKKLSNDLMRMDGGLVSQQHSRGVLRPWIFCVLADYELNREIWKSLLARAGYNRGIEPTWQQELDWILKNSEGKGEYQDVLRLLFTGFVYWIPGFSQSCPSLTLYLCIISTCKRNLQ